MNRFFRGFALHAALLLCLSLLPAVLNAGSGPVISIVATADLQSQVAPTRSGEGGMARVASIAAEARRASDGTLMVSTGDDLMGIFYSVFKGVVEIEAMNLAGYDVVTPGNHEFDQGVDTYAEALSKARFSVVSSNLRIAHAGLAGKVKPYVVKDVAGVKVGLFGLMTPDLVRVSNVGDAVRVDGDVVAWARKMVSALRNEEKVDMVVALTHVGTQLDREIASRVSGIDVIVGGHSHEYVHEVVDGPGGWKTVVVQAGAGGREVGVLTFVFDGGVRAAKWRLVKAGSGVEQKPEVKRYLAPYIEKFRNILGHPVGESKVGLDARKETVRAGESNIGDLIVDTWLGWFCRSGPCVALMNGGGIRGDRIYPKGPLSYKDILGIHPFGNTVFEVRLTGAQLKQVLEIGASALRRSGDGCPEEQRTSPGGFLQVGGLRMVIDPSRPPFCAEYDGRELKRLLSPGERVRRVQVLVGGMWTTIDPDREYRVYVNSWLASGGDGYYLLRSAGAKDTTVAITDILLDYVKRNSPISPATDGRISILR